MYKKLYYFRSIYHLTSVSGDVPLSIDDDVSYSEGIRIYERRLRDMRRNGEVTVLHFFEVHALYNTCSKFSLIIIMLILYKMY